ncbi:hypothetical protein [Luteitalea sp.]
MVLSGVVLGTPLLAQGPATVVIVIDDTQVRPGDGPRVAELIDTLERDLLGESGAFGIVTVGPAGLNIDLTKDRQRLREVREAARAGHLEFKGAANPEMAAGARVASLRGIINGLATRSGPKAVLMVGRAATVTDEQRPAWNGLRRDADSARLAVAWFDLGSAACASGPSATDAALVADTNLCATLSSKPSTTAALLALRRRLEP